MTETQYLIVKSIHIIAVISWMAGMLYLPRLFVYHAENQNNVSLTDTFKIMERRLLRFIMTPAMLVSWIFGLALMIGAGWSKAPWMNAKLLLVVVMSGVHGWLSVCVKRFARDENQKTGRYFRVLNEIPTVLMIVVVFLVVLKPF
jgi:putative membrane protein